LAQPQWAPRADQLRLAYAARHSSGPDRDIYVLDLATDDETVISSGPDDEVGPTWSPDGTRLAWLVPSQSYLRIASIARSSPVMMVPSDGMTTPAVWSPDGTKVYGSDPTLAFLLVVTVDGSSPTVQIIHARGQGLPAWQRLAP
jgi:Tol biopolymer transport system component